ncbi:hypothetical protein JG688_00005118 [Phytophthora aleatoria]|uniref:5'-nucleotidase n=1 Tax=Phytophthora aleatoria TaxID=2496075 RepID=A0A8J5J035_9STRA|nr:hypothetical protein JG688_00005118 [Phytophthora aleatoria]
MLRRHRVGDDSETDPGQDAKSEGSDAKSTELSLAAPTSPRSTTPDPHTSSVSADPATQVQRDDRIKRIVRNPVPFGSLVEALSYVMFLILFILATTVVEENTQAFYFANRLKSALVDQSFTVPAVTTTSSTSTTSPGTLQPTSFTAIRDQAQMWAFLQGPFADVVYGVAEKSNTTTTSSETGSVIASSNRLLGGVRLRTLRVKAGSCPSLSQIPEYETIVPFCYGKFSSSVEETRGYGLILNSEDIVVSISYTTARLFFNDLELNDVTKAYTHLQTCYSDCERICGEEFGVDKFRYTPQCTAQCAVQLTQAETVRGYTDVSFPGSGYVVDLGFNGTLFRERLAELKTDRYLDLPTRALIVDFTVYNAYLQLFNIVEIVVEFPASGGAFVQLSDAVLRLFRYSSASTGRVVLEGFVVFYVFIQWWRMLKDMYRDGVKGFLTSSLWNVLTALHLVVFATTIAVRLYTIDLAYGTMSGKAAKAITSASLEEIPNLQGLATVLFAESVIESINAALVWMKLLQYTTVSKRMSLLLRMLGRAARDLAWFFVCFLVCICAFAQIGLLLFGLDAVAGELDYAGMADSHRVAGPVFYILYYLLLLLILVNVFLAILNDARVELQQSQIENLRHTVDEDVATRLEALAESNRLKTKRMQDLEKTLGSIEKLCQQLVSDTACLRVDSDEEGEKARPSSRTASSRLSRAPSPAIGGRRKSSGGSKRGASIFLFGATAADSSPAPSTHALSYNDGHHGRAPRMIIGDPDAFARKMQKFVKDGPEQLLVIADFDRTLTPYYKPRSDPKKPLEPESSSHGLLMTSSVLSPEVAAAHQKLFARYYPVEISSTLSAEEKSPFMAKWWESTHSLLIEYKLSKDQQVPTLVFSAGLYDVIHAALEKEFAAEQKRTDNIAAEDIPDEQKFTPDNVHVVSNMMRFDARGRIERFDGRVIHPLTKTAHALLDSPFWKECQLDKRRNVLLLGDSRGDVHMADGLDADEIIRVGFLNLHVDEALEEYLELYDVVFTNDASLVPVQMLIEQITASNKKDQRDEALRMTANKGNTAVMNPSVPPTPESPGRKTNIPDKSSPRHKQQQVEGVPPNANSKTPADQVKLGLHMLTGEKVAVKILEKKRIVQAADVERVAREIKILKRNRHQNVIQLYEVIDSPDRIFLIMEHIDGGEMFEYIVAHHRIREPEAAFLFRQIVEGLAYLHSNEVTHRDLKPENLLLQSNRHNARQQQQQSTNSTLLVKIVDFGLSNTHDGGRLLRTACGSPCYAAPEMIQGRLYRGPIADMWSLGVVLFAMVCGFLPFEDSNTNMLYKKILSANYKMPTFLSANVQDLIRRILETDPEKRYTVDKILQHPWLAGVQNPDISGYDVGEGFVALSTAIANAKIDSKIPLFERVVVALASGTPVLLLDQKISTERLDKLIVIADFDYTLTPAYKPTDDQALSSHSLLMESEALGPQAETVAREIFEKYFPIEQSATLTKEEKLPFMIEWWTKTHELMIQHGVSKSAVKKAVEESDITLREGFMEIFDLLARENVPTLIFSAGLYDVIHAVLDKEYAKTPAKTPPKNVHVISNMMRFDENDKVVGFDGTLIHSLNKNASALVKTAFWKQCQLEKRHNILLLGDSLGDANMANGLDFKEDEIVRIGFLNDGADEKLDQYLQRFDVVLTNDSSLLPVELLLHQIQQ